MFGQRKKWGSAVAARRRLASVLVLSFSILLVMLFLAPPASAVTGCVFADGTVTVNIDSPATAIIGVNVVAGDDEIVFDNDNTLAGAASAARRPWPIRT